ncbi:fibropellin-1-like [Dreissena polymorpha]|uniref:fibropellin-1-like n=1 Tax=Dreissena polymorpha TaxID=45954 RepID=UPI0022642FB2|nr:fibropellin-1-like [Dreissena polymorpha]
MYNPTTTTGTMKNNPCAGRRCLQDKLCFASLKDADQCVCTAGYIFVDKSNYTCLDLDECSQHFHDPCGHRGVCMNTVGSYRCACLQGWTTNNHCLPKVLDPGLCMPGYTGETCSVSNCGRNGYGEPVGDTDDFICVCNKGWTHTAQKDACDLDVNECNQTPGTCDNGASCENSEGSYKCHCRQGWTGTNCSQYNCTNRACANNGVCDGNVCKCAAGWVGQDCLQSPTPTTTPTKDNLKKETNQV